MLCNFCGKPRLRFPFLPVTVAVFSHKTGPVKFHHHVAHHRAGIRDYHLRKATSDIFSDGLWITPIRFHSTCSMPAKWVEPKGYDSGIKIFHPIKKEKVPLILRQEKLAQWYACGPTVYDSTHIGHASSYVRLDIIRRIMGSVFDIDTTFVMGVTDVDDKIINKAKETGQDMDQMTKLYEAEFFTDMANLNVTLPNVVMRVKEHIPIIIDFVSGIERKGLAYKAQDGSVYFDVKAYGKYGVFPGHLKDVPAPAGPPTEIQSVKNHTQDFALWKASKPGEPWWDSPWGHGRPGWHVECSAMASAIFGANFDLHTGGEDLMFPHHENELAQSCAYHSNTQWVNYWIHTGHLFLSGQTEKMSKSLKNIIPVSEFLSDYTPNQFRMLCLLSNYRKRIEYSEERMNKAVSTMSTLNSLIKRCQSYVNGQVMCGEIPEGELFEQLHTTRRVIEEAFADDFNTPKALSNLMRLVKYTNLLLEEGGNTKNESVVRSNAPVAAVGTYVQRLLKQLGLDIGRKKAEEETETHLQFYKAVEAVVSSRDKIRVFTKDKQFMIKCAEEAGIPEDKAIKLMSALYKPLWDASDKIRADILSAANVQISDGVKDSTWSIVDTKKKKPKKDTQEGPEIPSEKVSEKKSN